jgi:hypothetical protein
LRPGVDLRSVRRDVQFFIHTEYVGIQLTFGCVNGGIPDAR